MKKGKLKPGEKLIPTLGAKKTPRCQFVKAVPEEEFGVQCKNASEPARPYCRFHGGRAGTGKSLKTGAHSKYHPVPSGLKDKFESSLQDPELLNLSSNIALIEAQIYGICTDAESQKKFDEEQTEQILRLMKQKKELVEQEMARRISIGRLMDVADVLQLINYIYESVQRNVTDDAAKRRIAGDLRRITAQAAIGAESQIAVSN